MKWSKMKIFILLMFAMLVGCGKSTEQQIEEQMSLGQKYLEEANYEEAIVAFNKVIEIDPLVAEAYVGIAQCYENQTNYEESLNILEEGVQVVGRDMLPEEIIDQMTDFYRRLSEYFSQRGSTDLVLRCYSAILQLQPDNEEIREKEEEIRVIQEKRSLLEEMAYSIVEEDVYDFQDMEILSEDFQALIAELEEPVIFVLEDGLYLGVYPGGYIYYGEMEDGERSGNGYWYYGGAKRVTKVRCEWEDDIPNGSATLETYTNPAEANSVRGNDVKHSGQVEKGVYVGYWNWIVKRDDGNHEFDNVFFINGQGQGIGVTREGEDIHAYCVQCGSDHSLLVGDRTYGIAGCH